MASLSAHAIYIDYKTCKGQQFKLIKWLSISYIGLDDSFILHTVIRIQLLTKNESVVSIGVDEVDEVDGAQMKMTNVVLASGDKYRVICLPRERFIDIVQSHENLVSWIKHSWNITGQQ